MQDWIVILFFSVPACFGGMTGLCFRTKKIHDPFPPSLVCLAMTLASLWFRIYLWTGMFWTGYVPTGCEGAIERFVWWCLAFDVALVVATALALCLLPACNPRDTRKGGYHRGYALLGMVFFVPIFFHGFISRHLLVSNPGIWMDAHDACTFITIAWLVGLWLCIFYGAGTVLALVRVARFGAEATRSLALLAGNAAPIVLLRSFDVDRKTVFGRTMDEALCSAAVRAGVPVVSLCAPDEFLPTGGSVKIQAKDDTWKEVVLTLLHRCRAVIMCEGVTEGLRWEVRSFNTIVAPSRFFIITPPFSFRMRTWFQCTTAAIPWHWSLHKKDIRQIFGFVWTKFCSFLRAEGINVGTYVPESKTVIEFDDDWKETCRTRWKNGESLLRSVLEKTLVQQPGKESFEQLAKSVQLLEIENTLDKTTSRRIKFATMTALASVASIAFAGMMLAVVP
jgi:hypothetical protein